MVTSRDSNASGRLDDYPVWSPAWRAGRGVRALTTYRHQGCSVGAYASLNLGDHVGDVAQAVATNRQDVANRLQLPSEPLWLKQVHGTDIVCRDKETVGCTADGAIAQGTGKVLAVMTADCLPVFLVDSDHSRIGLLHAGWRGLAAGIIERGIERMGSAPDKIQVALGPALGPAHFEVGDEVREALMRPGSGDRAAFKRGNYPGKWMCNIYQLAVGRVIAMGCSPPSIPDTCTYRDEHLWFSFRRDVPRTGDLNQPTGADTGRMVSLLWIDDVVS